MKKQYVDPAITILTVAAEDLIRTSAEKVGFEGLIPGNVGKGDQVDFL